MSGDLYRDRKMSLAYPDLEREGAQHFTQISSGLEEYFIGRIERLWDRYLAKLIDVGGSPAVCVIGCGPRPVTMKALAARGCKPVGVEPVAAYVATANEFLGNDGKVMIGAAEKIDLPDGSQDVVFCESILEHVDSPRISLDEFYRVLKPGGVAFISTTNRRKFSLSGDNAEFNVPFFNWFPDSVKEGYVFEHLHYRPSLANNTPRPAVHWFTYAELCKLGRQSGFAQFYSVLDLTDDDDPALRATWLRRLLLRPWMVKAFRRSPWLRALALTQVGGQVFMLKRR